MSWWIEFASIVVLRLVALLVGAAMVWLGYQLFRKGHTAPAGDVEVTGQGDQASGNWKLTLRNAAPGVFFVIAGAAVMSLVVTRPIEIKTSSLPTAVAAAIIKVAGSPLLSADERTSLIAWLQTAQSGVLVAQTENPGRTEPSEPDMRLTIFNKGENSETWYDPVLRVLGIPQDSREGDHNS